MRRLLLLRHAKSSWADPDVRDHDRPLNDRGRQAAARMGDELRARGLAPELVLCSSARRTCETVALLGLTGTVLEVTHDLYLAVPATVVTLVRATDHGVTMALVVGHNPTIQDVALDLAGAGDPDALTHLGTKYPTGALAVLRFDGPWSGIGDGAGYLEAFLAPRDLE